jgi:hypothetical protein
MQPNQEENISSGLRELTIVPSKKKSEFAHLAYLCSSHLARTLDTTAVLKSLQAPQNKMEFKNPEGLSETSTCQLGIIPENGEDLAFAPSDVIEVPVEDNETIIHLSRVSESISLIAQTLEAVCANLSRTLLHMIEENNFDFEDVMFFLREFAIITEVMFKFDGFDGFSEMWQILQDLSIQNVETFESFIETDDFQCAIDILWLLLTVTQDQSLFLKTCVEQTGEYHALMQELSKSWHTMLDIQNRFIVKLIQNLDASRTKDCAQFSNFAQC